MSVMEIPAVPIHVHSIISSPCMSCTETLSLVQLKTVYKKKSLVGLVFDFEVKASKMITQFFTAALNQKEHGSSVPVLRENHAGHFLT